VLNPDRQLEPPRFSGGSGAEVTLPVGQLDWRAAGSSICLSFGGRDITDGFQQSMVVKSLHRFQLGELRGLFGVRGRSTMDQLGFF
jgi:hypothetical protein